jgi:hypothetical protein
MEAQSLSVKRAQVGSTTASLGEPIAPPAYAEENQRRGSLLAKHLDFVGPLTFP